MSVRWSQWLAVAVALAAGASRSEADAASPVLEDRELRAALVWQALPVTVVDVDDAGWPIAGGAERTGEVEVGPRTGAKVRLASLAVARVRVLGGGRPSFHRLTGAARVAEAPAWLSQGTWLLEQPPGEVSEWLVTADGASRVIIEGVRPRTGDLIWEHALGAVLAWIDDGGPAPPLPEVPEAEATSQALLADAEIAKALAQEDAPLRAAVRAWRRAAAIQRLTAMRTPIRAAFGLELRPRALEAAVKIEGDRTNGWQRVRGEQTHLLELRGPGVLWVEGRGIGGGGEISVVSEGRALASTRLRAPAAPVSTEVADGTGAEGQVGVADGTGPEGQADGSEGVTDRRRVGGKTGEDVDLGADPAAAGRADLGVAQRLAAALGVPVGAPGVVRVALAPGLHEYRVKIAGEDTAVQLRSGRTNQRLAAAVRGEGVRAQLRKARRALRRSESPRAALVAALVAEVEGEPARDAGAEDASPVLALAQAELAARSDALGGAARLEMAREIAERAAKAPVGPLVWRARQRGLELAGDDVALVRALGGKRPADAPTAVLGRLAEVFAGPPLALRSPAVALLELARRRQPLDAGLRAVYRERWRSGTRWAALRADQAAGSGWTWIEPRPATDERVAGARSLWLWPVGKPQLVRVAPTKQGRTALLRMYADVPARGGAVGLNVGEQRWLAPVLGRVEPWQIALPPGEHPVTMTAPAGATLWSSRAPVDRPPDAHLLRMWPAGADEPVRFVLPAGREPAFVRVEVRALAGASGEVRVLVARDDAPAQAVDVRLPAIEPAIVPVQASAGLGGRASAVIRVEAGVRAVTVRVAEGGPRVAVSASIRATRAEEPAARANEVVVGAESDAEQADLADRTGATGSSAGGAKLADGTGAAGGAKLADGTGVKGEAVEGTGAALRTDGVAEQEDGAGLARLEELSKALQAAPTDPALRLQRAELLLDLDQPGYAYVDWQSITAGGLPPELVAPAMGLADRLDALDAPDSIDLSASEPVVVVPALAAAIGGDAARLNAIEPAVAAGRAGGPADGLEVLDGLKLEERGGAVVEAGKVDAAGPGDRLAGRRGVALAASVLRAGWLDQSGDADGAARVWAGVDARYGLWQGGLMGVHSFLAALDGVSARPGSLRRPEPGEPRADGAALAYGLALSVRRTVRTAAVQRLATVAATRSKWSRVASSERDAGVESLTVPRAPALPSPNAAVRQALVVPPWSHAEATLLRPGYATVLAMKREATALGVDMWCEEVRPGLADAAVVRVTLDGVDLWRGPVALREASGPNIDGLPAGRHRVEVELDPASRGHLCSVRLRDADGPVASVRPTTWRVARPGQPVEAIVLGPTTLAIEGRALLAEGGRAAAGESGRSLQISVGRGRGSQLPRATLALADTPDPSATPEAERTIHPGAAATRVITLPDRGPQRVIVATIRGPALVRLQQRLDGEPVPLPKPSKRSLDLGAIVDEVGPIALPDAALPAVAAAARPVQRFGATFAEVRVGSDDLDGADDLQPRLTSSVRVGWARELAPRRVWLQAAPELRPRQSTAMTGGGALALQVLFPRAGVRARATGEVLASQALGDTQWALRGGLRVDRPTWVARRLQLLPSAELALRGQSLGPPALAATEPIHPRMFTKYAATHPVALRPGLELRWQRWQDARMYAGADVVVNSDFKGLDQVNLRGGMLGVLAVLQRVVPEFSAEYEASVRMKDQFRGSTYVSHRVRVGLGFGLWAGRAARVVFGVSDGLFVSAPFGLRNVVDVWLRVDLVLGRGLRDYGPLDMAFRPVREPRLWLGGEGAP